MIYKSCIFHPLAFLCVSQVFCEQRHSGGLGAYQKDMFGVLVKSFSCLVSGRSVQKRILWWAIENPSLSSHWISHWKPGFPVRQASKTFHVNTSSKFWMGAKKTFCSVKISVKSPQHCQLAAPRHRRGRFANSFVFLIGAPKVGDGRQIFREPWNAHGPKWLMIDDWWCMV